MYYMYMRQWKEGRGGGCQFFLERLQGEHFRLCLFLFVSLLKNYDVLNSMEIVSEIYGQNKQPFDKNGSLN